MTGTSLLLASLDFVMREAALFAACGFLLLGVSDLAVDLIWIGRAIWRRFTVYRRFERACANSLAAPAEPGRLAIFVPAWREAEVIGLMLSNALATFEHEDYRLYVGCYPNDPDTIRAVAAVADPRVRLVVGATPGPTTKADCLNRIWEAMAADEAADETRVKAVVLHDAEDVVHPAELRVLDCLIERFDLVQLPVVPLIDVNSRWIAGTYADEFAESHGKELVVREALGAGLPSAGVGCAFSRDALEKLADGATPFDADSLTEDYELGLRMRAAGGRAAFVRLPDLRGGRAIATREYFPGTLDAAVAQKARWMTGIALSGWDRLGWNGGLAERWMRLRDRQAVVAALFLLAGYGASVLATFFVLAWTFVGVTTAPLPATLAVLLQINLLFLFWRLAMRFGFAAAAYGWREGLRAIPRIVVSNAIAMLAARKAVFSYIRIKRGEAARWDKTSHAFPTEIPAE